MNSKTIIISEKDLKEIQELTQQSTNDILSPELKKVLNFMKQRKFVTFELVAKKLGVKRRTVRNWLDTLREMGLIDRQYALIKSYDLVNRKTALHFIVEKKDERRKKK